MCGAFGLNNVAKSCDLWITFMLQMTPQRQRVVNDICLALMQSNLEHALKNKTHQGISRYIVARHLQVGRKSYLSLDLCYSSFLCNLSTLAL